MTNAHCSVCASDCWLVAVGVAVCAFLHCLQSLHKPSLLLTIKKSCTVLWPQLVCDESPQHTSLNQLKHTIFRFLFRGLQGYELLLACDCERLEEVRRNSLLEQLKWQKCTFYEDETASSRCVSARLMELERNATLDFFIFCALFLVCKPRSFLCFESSFRRTVRIWSQRRFLRSLSFGGVDYSREPAVEGGSNCVHAQASFCWD